MIKPFLLILLATSLVYGQRKPAPYYSSDREVAALGSFQPLSIPSPQARTLLKAGLSLPLLKQSSFTGYYAMIGFDALIEQRLFKGLAIVGGLENQFGVTLDGDYNKFYSLEMPVALRYYFSLGKRQQQRADGYRFFNPYVAWQTYNVLYRNLLYDTKREPELDRYQRGQLRPMLLNSGSVSDRFLLLETAYFQLGFQRQVFKSSYLDLNVVIPVAALVYYNSNHEYTLASPALINAKLGLAWWRASRKK